MDQHARAGVAERNGEAGVIGIRVRQHHRSYVGGHMVQRREIWLEPLAKAGQAGIDRGQAPLILDQVPVDELTTEAMHAGGNVGRGILHWHGRSA